MTRPIGRYWDRLPLPKRDSGHLRRYCRLRHASPWSFLRIARTEGRLYGMYGMGLMQCRGEGSKDLRRLMAEGRLFIALDEVKNGQANNN